MGKVSGGAGRPAGFVSLARRPGMMTGQAAADQAQAILEEARRLGIRANTGREQRLANQATDAEYARRLFNVNLQAEQPVVGERLRLAESTRVNPVSRYRLMDTMLRTVASAREQDQLLAWANNVGAVVTRR